MMCVESLFIALAFLSAGWSDPGGALNGSPAAGARAERSDPTGGDGARSDVAPVPAPFVIPVRPKPSREVGEPARTGVDWVGLSRASSRFLAVEHAFRLLTEPGTRSGLKGPFLRNYGRAVSNLHGWADGDEFYVNYVGHPMQGSVAGFLFAQSDAAYRRTEFGASPEYWKGKLRATAFAWAYSTQFEIGTVSEASIGAIQATFPQQGFVDHVITPAVGLGWMFGEDVVDRYVIKRLEGVTDNRYVRLLLRAGLNPARTFANVLQMRRPWDRDSRPGVMSYVRGDERRYASGMEKRWPAPMDSAPVAPFEFAITFQPERFLSGRNAASCLGGGATIAIRLAGAWQLMADIGGCKMTGLENNLSGDSLTYMAGPRWVRRIHGSWSGYFQALAGGNKVTEERMNPQLKKLLQIAASRDNRPPPSHDDYTAAVESNGFAVSTGGGLHYNLNAALTLRVAEMSYRHAWTSPLWGRDYSGGLQWSSGVVLRMGTW